MRLTGTLQKLKGTLKAPNSSQVEYSLVIGQESLPLNECLGQTLHFDFSGNIFCNHCGKRTKKSFQQGYCYRCATTLARCDICIVRPEKCHFHLSTCREPEWGKANCLIPHIVYLSNTSNLKVGITREINIPTRWIDQGAIQALPIARVYSRLQAGQLETAIAKFVADKTNWRALLKGETKEIDLNEKYIELRAKYENDLPPKNEISVHRNDNIDFLSEPVKTFNYPVLEYPEKIQSINPEKQAQFSSRLQGIKGQYLILEEGVLNIRNLTGYEVNFRVCS